MDRAGEVGDNSAMEGFFGPIKSERTARKVYRRRGQARTDRLRPMNQSARICRSLMIAA